MPSDGRCCQKKTKQAFLLMTTYMNAFSVLANQALNNNRVFHLKATIWIVLIYLLKNICIIDEHMVLLSDTNTVNTFTD